MPEIGCGAGMADLAWVTVLSERDLRLVRRATELAESLGDSDDHSVAAAGYDDSGEIVTGVNVFHFTGGPCAELVLLGRAAERRVPVRLEAIVAVGTPSLAVFPPCGRCRQVLFDYYPDTRVVVHGKDGLQAVPVRELLPFAYDWRAPDRGAGGP